MTEEQLRRSEDIAARIIQTSQNALLLNLRFMDSAIFRLTPRQEDTTLATDGRYLYYGVPHILMRYRKEPYQVTRDLLHVVLHCVFRHAFVGTAVNTDIWDLAADIAVENIITSLDISSAITTAEALQSAVLTFTCKVSPR